MNNSEKPGPIFIGGPDRCGKTTLQAFLSSHPNIAIPVVGSNLWSYFYGQFGDLSVKENFERCLDALLHYKHTRPLKPDVERIRREFWQGEPSYARLFGLMHQHYADRAGKPRWGDQTGLIERYADQIFAAFPTAKMLHMIRDPRDRYEASLEMWPDGKGRAGVATARWLYSVYHARRNQARYPDRYKIIQFETLIRQPEKTLREICDFLGETYTPAMLQMSDSPGHREKLLQGGEIQDGRPPLSEEFIGRYKKIVSKQEIAFIQAYTGRMMEALNYSRDPIQFTPQERLDYELRVRPSNMAKMRFWLAREAFQHRFPSLAGRKPSERMVLSKKEPGIVPDSGAAKAAPADSAAAAARPAQAERGPIFIGGLDRSGKTLLNHMLSAHPDLQVTRRTYMWTRYYNQFGDLSQPENLERCLAAMLDNQAIQALQPDVERIRAEFKQGPATYERLFGLFHQQNIERIGKRRWGDQLGLVERFADKIFSAFPGAQMIHMIRDPRDRYAATLGGKRKRKGRAGYSTARWQFSAHLARRNQQRYPGRYLVVRYEALVNETEKTLREICDFLGETYDPEMAAAVQEGLAMERAEQGEGPAETVVTANKKQRLSKADIAFTQILAARDLAQFGYSIEPVRLSIRERLFFYLIDLPANLAGMLAWRSTEGKQFQGS